MLKNMTLKSKILWLSGLIAFGLFFLGFIAYMQIHSYNDIVNEDAKRIQQRSDTLAAIEKASVGFKSQVQEWKNILLRGNEAEHFEKHVKGFDKQEALVQEQLTKAIALLQASGLTIKETE